MVDNGMENRDIVALAADWKDAIVQIFFVREGKLIGRDHFHVAWSRKATRRNRS